jgi:hypothetical protein
MSANVAVFTSWSTTAASNQPESTDSADIVSDLQKIQAEVRKYTATKGADIASASTVDLSGATGNYVHVTGTTTVTALGTVSAGVRFLLVFDGALTFTHNASSLILPGAANITTAAGDRCEVVSLGSGNWRCLWYQNAANYYGVERTWTAQQTPMGGSATATTTAAWDCDVTGQVYDLTVGTTDFTMSAPSNVNNQACYILRVTQHASTPRVITWNAAYKFAGGVDPALTATASAVDIFTFVGAGSNVMHCVGQTKALA